MIGKAEARGRHIRIYMSPNEFITTVWGGKKTKPCWLGLSKVFYYFDYAYFVRNVAMRMKGEKLKYFHETTRKKGEKQHRFSEGIKNLFTKK
jgi:hypothetical protein